MPLDLPKSRAQIAVLQSERKRVAVAQAKRAPFSRGKLDHVNVDRLDDPRCFASQPVTDVDKTRLFLQVGSKGIAPKQLKAALRITPLQSRAGIQRA